jgi:hypothetical protein
MSPKGGVKMNIKITTSNRRRKVFIATFHLIV